MTVQLLQSKKILGSFTKYKMIPEPIIQPEFESSPFHHRLILQFNPSPGLIIARCEGGAVLGEGGRRPKKDFWLPQCLTLGKADSKPPNDSYQWDD